jgi:hypothetical protein
MNPAKPLISLAPIRHREQVRGASFRRSRKSGSAATACPCNRTQNEKRGAYCFPSSYLESFCSLRSFSRTSSADRARHPIPITAGNKMLLSSL